MDQRPSGEYGGGQPDRASGADWAGEGAFRLSCRGAGFQRLGGGPGRFLAASLLASCSLHNEVLEPASLKVDRRQRRAKTDRLDVERMRMQWIRYLDGDREEWQVVWVPSPEQEDQRRLGELGDRPQIQIRGHMLVSVDDRDWNRNA